VPVTAKLSRNFYERLGDDIATELVDWFNAVDATYQAQLREVNELNWERFKAELHAQGAELRREMTAVNAALLEKISDLRSELLKWMFVYWSGTVLTVGGLMVALAMLLRD
jgi:hypothetical protein